MEGAIGYSRGHFVHLKLPFDGILEPEILASHVLNVGRFHFSKS